MVEGRRKQVLLNNLLKSGIKLWTREEDEILLKYYFVLPRNILCRLLPNRTWTAIKSRARYLGLYNFRRKGIKPLKDIDEEYIAGLFDSDGCVALGIGKHPYSKIGYKAQLIVDISQKYIAGLFDGDGCVTIGVFPNDYKSAVGFTMRLSLDVLLRRRPFDVLYEIQNFLMRKGIKATVKENQQQLVLRVSSRNHVKKFLQLILPYLRVKRPQAILMLNEVIPRLERGEHLTKEGFLNLMKLADILTLLKGDNPKNKKYNYDYFRRLWNG